MAFSHLANLEEIWEEFTYEEEIDDDDDDDDDNNKEAIVKTKDELKEIGILARDLAWLIQVL